MAYDVGFKDGFAKATDEVAARREREAVLVEALTSAQHAIYILEAHIDFIADGQQPEEHDGGCIALAKSQCRDALATVSDTAEKE